MLHRVRVIALAGALGLSAHASAQDLDSALEAFGSLPAVSDAAISADGSKLVLGLHQSGQSTIHVLDLDAAETLIVAGVDSADSLRGVGWADDRRPSFLISRAYRPGDILPGYIRFRGAGSRIDFFRHGVIDLETERLDLLSTSEDASWQDQGAQLYAPIEDDPGFGRMIGYGEGSSRTHPSVFRINLATGRSRVQAVRGDNRDTIGFLLDEYGEVAARIDSDESSNVWRLFAYDGNDPELLREGQSTTGIPTFSLEGLTLDGRLALLETPEGGDFPALYAINQATNATEVLFAAPDAEVTGAINDPWTRRVVGASWMDIEGHQHFFDPTLAAAYESAAAVFADGASSLVSWSRDRSRIIVFGEHGMDGGGYYLLDTAAGTLEPLMMSHPGVAAQPTTVRQSITYTARDGARIPAYLTLPANVAPENLPLVLLVHGGPHARDTFAFDWWAAFHASRGYAVLQPNYRGSSGYGRAWENAGRRQWGGLMQTDVEDGASELARAGIADPDRTCIIGASYGGYAALAGATLTPDRYACAASVAGVSDLVDMLGDEARRSGAQSMTSDFWRESIGDRREDRDRIADVSPAYLAEAVEIPILLMHGDLDTVVPIEQSRRMLRRLEDAGKDVRYVELSGDDHWLSNAETRTQMLRELDLFLGQHIGRR